MRGKEKDNKAREWRDTRRCGCARRANEKTVEGSCDAGELEERSILLITANHDGVGVSQGPRLAFLPLIGNEAQLPCSGPSRKGLDCCRSLGPARCDKFDGIATRARGAGGF